jgi:hypothetical protein
MFLIICLGKKGNNSLPLSVIFKCHFCHYRNTVNSIDCGCSKDRKCVRNVFFGLINREELKAVARELKTFSRDFYTGFVINNRVYNLWHDFFFFFSFL